MEVRRINPEGGIVREIKELRKRASSLETRPAGNIVIRETLTTTDPATGVSTTIGQLPDGSYGFQPFIGDLVPPPVATTPLVSVAPGIFTVSWDGSFVAGAEKPRDFQHVNVIGHKIVNGATTLSLEVGVIRLPSESVIVTPDVAAVGETWEFSLASEDYNGNVAVRGTRSAPVTMPSVVTDQGVNDALAQVNQQVVSAQSAAASAQNAADTAQRAADDAAQAVVDLGSITGTIYTQSVTPSANSNSLWIDTGHNNIPRRYLGKISRRVLVANLGGGSSVGSRLSSLGYAVSAISVTPTFDQASNYDIVAFDAGYAGLSSSINTLAVQLLDRGVSIFTSGNDTTSLPYLFTGSGTRGTPKNNIRPVGSHPAAQGWAQYSDNDLAYYLTGVNSSATITGVTLVGSTDQPLNIVREHPTSFARWAHVETYATPADVLNAHLNWIADNWVAVQDQGIISASSAAASAQNKADQAFNNAATAASAAGTAQSTADGKNTNWYQPDQPAGTGHKVGDTWFDTDDGYKLRTWNGSVWQTTQDSALAKQIADSKSLVYTQPTVPPIEARLATTVWYDTSLGVDKVVQKYWDSATTSWKPLTDKAATDAQATADKVWESARSYVNPLTSADGITVITGVVPTIVDSASAMGGKALRKSGTGNGWYADTNAKQAFDPTALYRMTVRMRITTASTTGGGVFYMGVQGYAANGTTLVNSIGADSTSSQHYLHNEVVSNPTSTEWRDYVYYFKGNAPGNMAGSNSVLNPKQLHANVRYFEPIVILDYNGGNGVWEVSHWSIDVIDAAGHQALVDASGKGEVIYSDTTPPASKQLAQNLWIDTTGGINIHKRWDGNAWVVAADSRIASSATAVTAAQATADSKSVVYTQSFTPPVEARLPQTLWNDTSLGLDKIVVKYWNGSDWTSLADKAATDASTSASTAMAAQSYSTNASFDDWTGTYPTGYTFWNSTPVKETTIVRRAPNAIRFNVADTTVQSGVAYASILSHAPNLEYFTVELDFYLVSGGLGQAGMILDWGGLTNNRAQINLFDEVPSPATGKWYRVVKTLRRPTNATGTFTSMNGYLMGQWSGHTGGGAAKNIIFDWFNIRPSSAEEILAFNSTTVAQTKADAAQAAAITAAQATTMLATAYSKNPSFDDWASTLPDTYSVFGAITPTKDTTNKRIGAHGLKFTVPGTEDAGINFVNNVSHMPNVEYITVELEFMLTSGTLAGAGVLIDWNGLTPIRSLVKLTDHVLTPVTGKWYRISAVVARPANATGTWTSMGGWLMANWNELGTKVAKTITYDWLNVRPSTAEEITAYKAPAKYTELSGATTTAQASADGKNKVHYSTSAASGTVDTTDGNRPFVEGDTWYQRDATTPSKIIAQWEFTGGAWVSRKITGLVLTEVDAGTITVGYLRGENLSATAIDGKTITGALIQTEQTANRGIKLTSTELAGYDTTGVKNFSLTSNGTLTVRGAIQSGSTIDGATITGTTGIQTSATALRGVKMSNSGILAYDGSGNLTFKLDSATGVVELPGLKANSITSDKLVIGSADNIIAEPSFSNGGISWGSIGSNGISIDSTGSRKGGPSLKIVNTAVQQASYNLPMERPVEAGASFFGSAWIKADVTIPASSVTLGARVILSTGSITYPIFQTNSAVIPANTWTRISGTVIAPSGAMTMSVYVASQTNLSTGNLWIDYVSVVRAGTGELIVDGALDAKTITGSTVQTESTANRGIKLTSTELAGYDTAGLKNFSLTSAGALTIVGAIQSGGTISGTQVTGSLGLQTSTSATAGVKMNNTGIKAWDGANNLTFHLDATTGYLELPGLKANSINGDRIVGGTVTAAQVRVGDFSNLVTNGFGDLGSGVGIGSHAAFTYDAVDKPSTVAGVFKTASGQSTVAPPSIFWDVTPNTEYVTEVWLKADLPNSRIYIELKDQANAHGTSNFLLTTDDDNPATPPTVVNVSHGSYVLSNLVVPTVWTKYTIRSTTTATATRLRVGNIFFNHLNGTERNAAVSFAIGTRRRVAGSLIVDGAITTAHMTSGTIDAGVLTAGSITAPKIASKAITVDKLVVSSTDNLIVEADFGNGGASWGTLNANKAIVATAGRGSLPALRVTGSTALQTLDNLVNRVTVGTEDRFRGSMYVKSSVAAASGVAKLRMKAYTTATAFTSLTVATSQALSAGVWTLVEGYSPALPANTIAVEFFLEVQNAATGTTLDIDYVGMTRAADGKLVIDGAIDGKTITGALFQTDNSPLDSAASRGIKLNSSGLKAYSPTGVKTFGIDALTGEVSSSGTFATTSSEYVEGSGTMTIGAIFGNLTYNSHTEYSGIPGIKFTRTHSSEGVKPPASILYDGKTINLSTYPDDNGFTPNTAGSHIGVGEGTITMGASRNGAIAGETIPSPQLELHGGTVAGPGYEHIDVMMSSKPSTDYMKVGLQIDNTREYGAYSQANPFAVSLVNYSDQYQPQKKGKTVISARDGGKWLIEGSRHSDGTTISSLSADASGNLWMGATESFRIGNFASNLNEIVISPGPGIVMKGQTKIVGDLTMDTNSGQWGGSINAASYKLNGVDLSAGEVQSWNLSGTIGDGMIPVVKLSGFQADTATSTVSGLGTAGTDTITITNAGVYNIHLSYGQNAGATSNRNFIEIGASNQDKLLARATFATGEDSVSVTASGVLLQAGTTLRFEALQYSGGTRNYVARVRLVRVAAPVPVTSWGTGDISQSGNVTVAGDIFSKPRFARFVSDNFTIAGNNTPWDSGPVTEVTSVSKNNNFVVPGPFAGSIKFTQSGWYQVSHFMRGRSATGASWSRLFLGSTGELLVQVSNGNGQIWEQYLSTVPIYVAANDYIRCSVVAATQHAADTTWNVVRFPWSVT